MSGPSQEEEMRTYVRWLFSDEQSWPLYLTWAGVVLIGIAVEWLVIL